jgi:hypothetical protein
MSIYATIVEKIIAQQEQIIGPVAMQQASLVEGIAIDDKTHSVTLTGNEKQIINELIGQYQELFGQIAVEVSKEAASKIAATLTPEQLPELLK